ncbi:Ras protein-specific guanine nucleotide-releasing factor, partial [Goodea atripinnis]
EFFGQGWMKNDKNEKTPYIMRTTKHFNDVNYLNTTDTLSGFYLPRYFIKKYFVSLFLKTSNLIATEILRCDDLVSRVAVIEKWVAVADICRCLHNYNAVLEITSSLNRSSVFRLKKTWLKVSKQIGNIIVTEQLDYPYHPKGCEVQGTRPLVGSQWQIAPQQGLE